MFRHTVVVRRLSNPPGWASRSCGTSARPGSTAKPAHPGWCAKSALPASSAEAAPLLRPRRRLSPLRARSRRSPHPIVRSEFVTIVRPSTASRQLCPTGSLLARKPAPLRESAPDRMAARARQRRRRSPPHAGHVPHPRRGPSGKTVGHPVCTGTAAGIRNRPDTFPASAPGRSTNTTPGRPFPPCARCRRNPIQAAGLARPRAGVEGARPFREREPGEPSMSRTPGARAWRSRGPTAGTTRSRGRKQDGARRRRCECALAVVR